VLLLAGDQSEIHGQRQLLKSVYGRRFTVDGKKKGNRKTKIPSTKSQIPNKFQIPITKSPGGDFDQNEEKACNFKGDFVLEIGICLLFGIWDLGFKSY
jgi:hypothetical protein